MKGVARGGTMKAKTIKRILRRRFDSWLKSIPDLKLQERIDENSIITGGSIVSMLLNEKASDYDIYFRDLETTAKVARYYVNLFKKQNPKCKFRGGAKAVDIGVLIETGGLEGRVRIVVKSAGIASADKADGYAFFEALEPGSPEQEEFIEEAVAAAEREEKAEKYEYKPVFLTSNAITLSDRVQLVIRFYGQPEEIHKNYDFIHCTNYWKSWDNELVLQKEALEAILTKELRYVGSLYPLCSLFRMRKFIKKGWTINAGQVLKIALQLNEMDLTDIKTLEDQLIGVDVAYMQDLINKLREWKEEKGKDKIDRIYICQLIDEIF